MRSVGGLCDEVDEWRGDDGGGGPVVAVLLSVSPSPAASKPSAVLASHLHPRSNQNRQGVRPPRSLDCFAGDCVAPGLQGLWCTAIWVGWEKIGTVRSPCYIAGRLMSSSPNLGDKSDTYTANQHWPGVGGGGD